MRTFFLQILAFSLFFVSVVSCSEKGGGTVSEETIPIVTREPTSVSPVGATVGGSIQNFSIGEITRGEFGILLSEALSDPSQDQSCFLEWKNSGSSNGIKVSNTSTIVNGTDFSVDIKNLVPGQTYLVCAFFIDKNGNRMVGKTIRFIVPEAEYCAVTERVESLSYINVVLPGTVKTNLPLDKLSYGVIWSETPNQTTLESGNVVPSRKISSDDGSYSVGVTYLHAGTTYYYRSYVSYDGEYSYGEELSFTTRNADEMAVDLGLSVLWADCNLGASSWEEDGLALAWGELKDNRTGDLKDYRYYVDDQFVDIGKEISGTEYDAAHVYLGGKWRMPTKDELKELMTLCNYGFINNGDRVFDWIFRITASNGNSIQFFHYNVHGQYYDDWGQLYRVEKSMCIVSGSLLTDDDECWRETWREYEQLKSHYWYVHLLDYDSYVHSSMLLRRNQRNMCFPIRPVRDRD